MPRPITLHGGFRKTEYLIGERDQLLDGHGIALLHAVEDAGDIAHRKNVRAVLEEWEHRKPGQIMATGVLKEA